VDELLEVPKADDELRRLKADPELVAIVGAGHSDSVNGRSHFATKDLDSLVQCEWCNLFLNRHQAPFMIDSARSRTSR
jgi:hypothetical protein